MPRLKVLDSRVGTPGAIIDAPPDVNVRAWLKARLVELAPDPPKKPRKKKAPELKKDDA